jgi:hypothetical protein
MDFAVQRARGRPGVRCVIAIPDRKLYGYAALTDESGVIWQGQPLHWGSSQAYRFTVLFISLEPTSLVTTLLWHLAGRSSLATVLHVAQNKEFEGGRKVGSRALACGPTLRLQPEMRKGSQAAPVHGSENGRKEVLSNGGKQLIPADGV